MIFLGTRKRANSVNLDEVADYNLHHLDLFYLQVQLLFVFTLLLSP